VNIAFTKIVTDPAKSVKTGVELSAGNELFLKSCNQLERYPSEIINYLIIHPKTHLYGTVFAYSSFQKKMVHHSTTHTQRLIYLNRN
jgi:hypothetical protein